LFFLDDSGYGDYAHHGNPTIQNSATDGRDAAVRVTSSSLSQEAHAKPLSACDGRKEYQKGQIAFSGRYAT